MSKKYEIRFAMGNEALAEGAIAAGATFYAGYPITPSSEVAEISSVRLPQVGGIYVQMEDEIGSMAAIIGASTSGAKSYTATSGPGLSLMQENLGVAIMSEVPCVVIDVQRCGPSTGVATKPAQGDVMAARWGTHGDHSIIAISPSSVQECYDFTIRAFNLAEKYRTPVIMLVDEIIGHMREQYELHGGEIVNRKQPDPSTPAGDFAPFDFEAYEDSVVPMPAYGGKHIIRMSGSMHGPYGFAANDGKSANKYIRHYINKIEKNRDDIVYTESFQMEDADVAIITFGCSVRPAMAAMNIARAKGLKVGVLKLVTIWPFADKEVAEVLSKVKAVIVPEMNLGQIRGEVERYNKKHIPIVGINRVDCEIITPNEVLDAIEEVLK